MTRTGARHLLLLITALGAASPSAAQESEGPPSNARLVAFQLEGGQTLHGFFYQPAGNGPFPAVLWNHGSEKRPGWQASLASFYVGHGYAFFVPHRRGHGRSDGDYIVDLEARLKATSDGSALQAKQVELHERYNEDVRAALAWLARQPTVDPDRIAMSGVSFGGIQTVLTAQQGLGIRAFVPFAPGAMSWRGNPLLRDRLRVALEKSRSPVFLLQAENDYDLGPSQVLGDVLRKKGKPNQARVYPSFGTTHQDGHGAFACSEAGIAIWGPDVLAFLQQNVARGP